MLKMAPHQLEFYRELLAPFASHELSEVPARGGKKTLTYLDKRAIENRLDSVCGPDGWYPEYESTSRGYKCRLSILVPTAVPGTSVWLSKEDGAGFEEMGSKNRETGEWEPDVDNDEKSGYTNALRRAAQDAWGIGRYLYNKGIPSFLDPNAKPLVAPPLNAGNGTPAAKPPIDLRDPEPVAAVAPHKAVGNPEIREAPPAQQQPAPSANYGQPAPAGQKPQGYDNFKIPPPGRAVFAWCKEMEKAFETKVFDGMAKEGESHGWGRTFSEWNEAQVKEIAMSVITFIRSLPTYKNQFEHLFVGQQPTGPVKQPVAAPGQSGVNLADLRREFMTAIQALVERQTGAKAEPAQLKQALQQIAPQVPNEHGHTGEVPESLAKCTDVVWIRNMVAFVNDQIRQAVAAGDSGQADIPF